ncbi:peptidase M10A and M12B matrixin and adamalysin [Synechococcus moorigangaii CMS01]|nr:peptidase M10A and M12B matrixin and adamalysin [Synechococcus moorigangaii CMS01]
MAYWDRLRFLWQRYSLGWRFCLGCLGGLAIVLGIHYQSYGLSPEVLAQFPRPQIHPLPATLVQATETAGVDYFEAISPSPLGHLVWSDFPVRVYFSPIDPQASLAAQGRQQQWQQALTEAIAQWQVYLPLAMVESPEAADIVIRRQAPPAEKQVDPATGKTRYFLGRNAVTTYEFYIDPDNVLRHRMTILLGDHQGAIATQNTARHELGHALGIWGHSLNAADALFAQQVGSDSKITMADINTLRKIYQQPTRLGWPMPTLKILENP